MAAISVVSGTFGMQVHASEVTTNIVNETVNVDVGTTDLMKYQLVNSPNWKASYNKQPVILDMDIYTDVDDVLALRLANALHYAGVIDLKGVVLSVAGADGVRAVHGLECYDGLYGVPVGSADPSVTEDGYQSPYWGILSSHCGDSTLVTTDAVNLYKQILMNTSVDDKAIIITTGYTNNVAQLLKDPEGFELVRTKCKALYITGAVNSPEGGFDNNFYSAPGSAEAINFIQKTSPVPIVYSTHGSIRPADGGFVYCGKALTQADTANTDPVTKSLHAFWGEYNVKSTSGYVDRFAWDPMCIFASVVNPTMSFVDFKPAHIELEASGRNKFISGAPANCFVIELTNPSTAYYENMLDAFIMFNFHK